MSTNVPCAETQSIEKLLAGELAADSRRALSDHADSCTTCREALLSRLSRWTASGAPTIGPGEQPPPAAPSSGQALGRYLLLHEIGAGGMGKVFAAQDTKLNRKVALKFLGGRHGRPPPIAQLLSEAAAMARLSHPNVVTVYDVGLIDEVPFISMELVEGVHLGTWRTQQPRTARQIAQVLAAAARGLAAAHGVGVIHRDVKPGNILVSGARVLVTDFGVALRGTPEDGPKLAGKAAGTPAYMAPEQLRGEPVDARADVFGLCATLYEMVHGAPPFVDLTRQERLRASPDRLPPPPTASLARLHRLAVRGLHPDPAQRPPSCEVVARELAADPGRRTRQLSVAAGVLVAAAGAFWGSRALLGNPERQCRAGESSIAGVWNGERRTQLAARYAAAPSAAGSWSGLERMLDSYTAGWRAMYGETCAATYGGQGQPGPVFELRIQCLDARRAALDAFLGALASATPPQLLRASRAVLPEVSDCAATGQLQKQPLPTDPQARAQIKEIEQALARAQTQFDLGDYAGSAATSADAAATARKLGYEPLLAALLTMQGTALVDVGSGSGNQPVNPLDRAAKIFEEAYAAAERGRDDRERLKAARGQILLHARRQDFKEGERWARVAEGVLERLGSPAEGCLVYSSIGWLKQFQGKDDEAAAAFRRSLEMARKMDPPSPRRVAVTQAGVCRSTRDTAQRVACSRDLIQTMIAAYGPEHPTVGTAYALLGEGLLLDPSTHAEACPMFRKAIEMTSASIPPTSPNAVSMRNSLAVCLAGEGQVQEAKVIFEEVIARNPGPTDLGHLHTGLGYLLSLHFDLPAGVRHIQQGLASFLKAHEPSNGDVLAARNTLAEVLIRGGQLAQAQRVLDDGLRAVAKDGLVTQKAADLRARTGAVLLTSGRAEAALRAFEEARLQHEKAGTDERGLTLTLHGLGASLLALGRVDAALSQLERAWKLRPAAKDNNYELALRADIPLTLARALRAKGGARARVCDLAREAVTSYRRMRNPGRGAAEAQRLVASERCLSQS
jgi:tetratricopeptide (TPR) repeat protein